jgi:hypothetical protein
MEARAGTARRLAPRVLTILVGGAVVGLTVDLLRRLSQLTIGDFETYWTGARRVLEGRPLYPDFQLHGPFVLGDAAFGRGFVYPPTAALIAAPLGGLPMEVAFVLFTLASAASLATVVYLIGRGSGLGRAGATIGTAILVGTGPGLDALLTGNVNALAAAGLGAMWLWPRSSGAVSTIGALVKVYPGIGILWAVRRRTPLVAPIVVGSVVVAASLLLLGSGAWRDFLTTMANGVSTEYFVVESPRSLLGGVIGSSGAAVVAAALTAVACLSVLRLRDDGWAFLVLGIAMILPAPDWHLHYFIVTVVGAWPLVARSLAARRTRAGDRAVAAPALPG